MWDGRDEEGREDYQRAIQTRKDWVVWIRARPTKVDGTRRWFEHVGKTVFCHVSYVEKLNEARKRKGSLKQKKIWRVKCPTAKLT